MLQLTPEAIAHILRVRQEHGFGEEATARFARTAVGTVGLTFAAGPEPDDRVVDGAAILVFAARDIAATLDNSIIDARSDSGKMVLVMRPQAGSSAMPNSSN